MDDLSIAIEYQRRLDDIVLDQTMDAKLRLMRAIIHAGKLSDKLWENSAARRNSTLLKSHIRVLQRIDNFRQEMNAPWIFTTNYDLAIEWAAESIEMKLFSGVTDLNNKQFTPYMFDSIIEPKLVKLHGSLSWEIVGDNIHKLSDEMTKQKTFQFIGGKLKNLEQLIFPGSSKYLKSIKFLYGELLRQFGNFLAKKNPVLFVVGYGFGDEHINQQIISALRFRENLRILVYYPALNNTIDTSELPIDLQTIFGQSRPNVTIIGGGEEAFFEKFSNHLPDD